MKSEIQKTPPVVFRIVAQQIELVKKKIENVHSSLYRSVCRRNAMKNFTSPKRTKFSVS